MTDPSMYHVGGTVPPPRNKGTTRIYIERNADKELYEHCKKMELCYVLTARQMGKSSMMVRTVKRLRDEGLNVVRIDFTSGVVGADFNSMSQFYTAFLNEVFKSLNINDIYADEWWSQNERIGSGAGRFKVALEEIVLKRVEGNVIIFIDEVDYITELKKKNFATDDFFAVIRAMMNERADNPTFERLNFVMLGVARPSDLIASKESTPFNIGTPIHLTFFTEDEAMPFAQGLALSDEKAREVIQWVLSWTNGHPFLTQSICYHLAIQPQYMQTRQSFDTMMTNLLKNPQDLDKNLDYVRQQLLKSVDTFNRLRVYYRVLTGRSIPDDNQSNVEQVEFLKLHSILAGGYEHPTITTLIYKSYFDTDWIAEQLKKLSQITLEELEESIQQEETFRQLRHNKSSFGSSPFGRKSSTSPFGKVNPPPKETPNPPPLNDNPPSWMLDTSSDDDDSIDWLSDIDDEIKDDSEPFGFKTTFGVDDADTSTDTTPPPFGTRLPFGTPPSSGGTPPSRFGATRPPSNTPSPFGQSSPPSWMSNTDDELEEGLDIYVDEDGNVAVDTQFAISKITIWGQIKNIAVDIFEWLTGRGYRERRYEIGALIIAFIVSIVGALGQLPIKIWGIVALAFAVLPIWTRTIGFIVNYSRWLKNNLPRAFLLIRPKEFILCQAILTSVSIIIGLLMGGVSVAIYLAILAFALPYFGVRYLGNRRLTRFTANFPSAINLMVNGLRSGYSVLQAFEATAKDISEPVKTEFSLIVSDVQMGVPLSDALSRSLDRTMSEDFDLFVTAINIQREVGGNLTEILEIIGLTIRERIQLKKEAHSRLGLPSLWVMLILWGMLAIQTTGILVYMPTLLTPFAWIGIALIILTLFISRFIRDNIEKRLEQEVVFINNISFLLIIFGLGLTGILAFMGASWQALITMSLAVIITAYIPMKWIWCIAGATGLLTGLWWLIDINSTPFYAFALPSWATLFGMMALIGIVAEVILFGFKKVFESLSKIQVSKTPLPKAGRSSADLLLTLPFLERTVGVWLESFDMQSLDFSLKSRYVWFDNQSRAVGYRVRVNAKVLLFSQIILSVMIGSVGYILANLSGATVIVSIISAIIGWVLGYLTIFAYIMQLKQNRQRRILIALPDAIDMLTICVEAGLGFDQAMGKVYEKWDNDLSLDFGRILRDIQLGQTRRDALRAFANRYNIQEVSDFVASLIQSDQLGVSMSRSLRIQSDQLRNNRRTRIQAVIRRAENNAPIIFYVLITIGLVLWLIAPLIS